MQKYIPPGDIINRQRKNNENGFTLVELLVVIIIIGILTAVAIPAFNNQREKAVIASMQADAKAAGLAYEAWKIDYPNSTQYPIIRPTSTTDPTTYTWGQGVAATNAEIKMTPGNILTSSDLKVPAPARITDYGEAFCIHVTHATRTTLHIYYSSIDGGLLPEGKTCATGR